MSVPVPCFSYVDAICSFPVDLLGEPWDVDGPTIRRGCLIYGWEDNVAFVKMECPITGLNFHMSVPFDPLGSEVWFHKPTDVPGLNIPIAFDEIKKLGSEGTATWGLAPKSNGRAWFVSGPHGSGKGDPYEGPHWGEIKPRFFFGRREAAMMARTIRRRGGYGSSYGVRGVPEGLTVGVYPGILLNGEPYVALSYARARELMLGMTGEIEVVGLYEDEDADDRESVIIEAQAQGHYPDTVGFAIFTRDDGGDWRASCDSWAASGAEVTITSPEVMRRVEAYLLGNGYPFKSNESVYYTHLVSS
jgi:hypothetical protein